MISDILEMCCAWDRSCALHDRHCIRRGFVGRAARMGRPLLVVFGLAVISALFVAASVVNFVEGGWPLIGKSLLWLIPAEFIWIAAFSMLFKKLAVWRRH
uniref:Uncharacterized protein n=1 Tax=Bosea sp. NBC_00436 TaxID=2969620 RepID=A0A9E7ZP69_9HYPH